MLFGYKMPRLATPLTNSQQNILRRCSRKYCPSFYFSRLLQGKIHPLELRLQVLDSLVIYKNIQKTQNNVQYLTAMNDNHGKEYFVSNEFRTTGSQLRAICRSFGMDTVSLDTVDEQNTFLNICNKNRAILDSSMTLIGGYTRTPRSTNDWYWVNSGNRVNYTLKFSQGQPDFAYDREYCLSVWGKPSVSFNDVGCGPPENRKFFCQKILRM